MSGKIDFSNPAKLSGSGGIFARAGFLPDLEKCRIPVGAGIRYSPTNNVQLSEKLKQMFSMTTRQCIPHVTD